jgi:anti-sigma-K factor RskA
MNCDDFRAAHLEGREDPEVASHPRSCADCRAVVANLTAGRGLLADSAVWEEPPPALGARVEALIGSSSREQGVGRRWRLELVLGAAAAVVVIVVGVVAALQPSPPDWETAIPGTSVAPAATATLAGWHTDRGTRMVLDTVGLEPAPTGHVYELWLSQGPVHISAGTFTAGGPVEMWVGVERADYPRLWVTLEPIDDDPTPSSRTVLDTG